MGGYLTEVTSVQAGGTALKDRPPELTLGSNTEKAWATYSAFLGFSSIICKMKMMKWVLGKS